MTQQSSTGTASRGQTEPLAALVAVVTFSLAISIYGGYVTDTLSGTSEQALEESTTERVWNEIATDGYYDASHSETALSDRVSEIALPDGYVVDVSITMVHEGEDTLVDSARFGPTGEAIESQEQTHPPDHAPVETRLVAVKTGPGDVRSGTLTVTVWS